MTLWLAGWLAKNESVYHISFNGCRLFLKARCIYYKTKKYVFQAMYIKFVGHVDSASLKPSAVSRGSKLHVKSRR